MTDYDIRDYGAVCDGLTPDTAAIQAALDAAKAAGGGRVVLPAGKTSLCGGIVLRSQVELHLAIGATLLSTTDISDRVPLGDFPSNFNDANGRKVVEQLTCLIACEPNAQDVRLTGPGCVDGRGREWIAEAGGPIHRVKPKRPRLIVPIGVQRLTIRDLVIRDAPNWTLHPAGCTDVLIEGVRILNDLRMPNCDGIDLDHCRRVRVIGCHIEAGDDGIVIKNHAGFADLGPTEDLVISACTVISTSCAIKIGTESHETFRRILVTGCIISGSNRGLGIQIRDGALVEDVVFSSCIVETRRFSDQWWGKSEIIHVSAAARRPGDRHPTLRGLTFRDIRGIGESGVLLWSHPDAVIEDVTLDNVDLRLVDHGRFPGGWCDLRPQAGEEHGGVERATEAGFRLTRIADARLRACRVRWGAGTEAWGGAGLSAEACPDLRQEACDFADR